MQITLSDNSILNNLYTVDQVLADTSTWEACIPFGSARQNRENQRVSVTTRKSLSRALANLNYLGHTSTPIAYKSSSTSIAHKLLVAYPIPSSFGNPRWRVYVIDTVKRQFMNMGMKNGCIFEFEFTKDKTRRFTKRKLMMNIRCNDDDGTYVVGDDLCATVGTYEWNTPTLCMMVQLHDYQETFKDGKLVNKTWGQSELGIWMRDSPIRGSRHTFSDTHWDTMNPDMVVDDQIFDGIPMREDDIMIGLSAMEQLRANYKR